MSGETIRPELLTDVLGRARARGATEADGFFLFGSLPAEVHHSRWFRHHVPADGSVRFIRGTVTPKTLNALFTRNGGEAVGNDF